MANMKNFHPEIHTHDSTHLFEVTASWNDEYDNSKWQQNIVAAKDRADAAAIARNHIPATVQNKINPDDIKMRILDLGPTQKDRTYYTSPVLPDTYKPIEPGDNDRYQMDWIAKSTVQYITQFAIQWGTKVATLYFNKSEDMDIIGTLLNYKGRADLIYKWATEYTAYVSDMEDKNAQKDIDTVEQYFTKQFNTFMEGLKNA